MVGEMRGITLIELLVVISIIGIIMVIATINIQWFMRESKLNEIRDVLIADLEDIKLKSITGVPHGIRFDNKKNYSIIGLKDMRCSNDTTIQCYDNSDCPGGSGECSVPGNLMIDMNEQYKIISSAASPFPLRGNYIINYTASDDNELWFDRKGLPRKKSWALHAKTITICYDSNGDGVCDSGEHQKNITINNAGKIQYEK